MKKKSISNNIDNIPYSNPQTNIQTSSKVRNTITAIQPRNSKNYFRLYKEYETNPNNINNNSQNQKYKKINSLNEKIYENNSKKLGEYYTKNKEDLFLYGSSKYDLLTVDNLVQEMKQYRNSIIEKIKQNPNKYKLKNYGLKNSNTNMILTPLAEKDRSKMGNNEKELFNLAERRGVVMRRIEYSNSLTDDKDNIKIFLIMKNAVKLIEKCWIFYKGLKKRKIIRGIILVDKYIKRKFLRLLSDINNEKLKNIYMNLNLSSISFKNNLNLKNSDNSNENNNKRYFSLNKKFWDKLNICSMDKINIIASQIKNDSKKSSMDDLQKKYCKLILDYKMIKEELNKYKKENSQLNQKLNKLENENKEINILKNEKEELIKKFDEINSNYNNLLKDFDALNANNSNLLSNQSIIFNSFKNNNIPIKESEEYISILNEYNSLNDKYNQLLNELDEIKMKNNELNEIILKNNQVKNSYVPIDEETINEINEYKNKIEELNNQLLKKENEYVQQIKILNENINNLNKDKEDLNKNLNDIQLKIEAKENKDNNNYINQIKLLENKINNYEIQITKLNNKINEKEILFKNKEKEITDFKSKIIIYEKDITQYKNKEKELKDKINDLEQRINLNKAKDDINNSINNENNNLKIEINKQKSIIIKYKQDIDNMNIKQNESQKKINSYLMNINRLKEEINKNKITIGKLNNLIIGLNNRIKQLLEENKNIRDNIKNKYFNNNTINKIFLLFIDKIFKKKLLEYKSQLMMNLFQENINNFTKYIIYQNDSARSSINLDGYEKVITGESKRIITKENNQNNVSYDNKIIIHKDLDDTLKEYIIKGKDNLAFDEIFEEDNKNNIIINDRNNKIFFENNNK